MLIEGENLEVLRVLQKSYYGKVKMIYIDPPYNTGNDSFVYPDDYTETLEGYQRRTGERDASGFLNKQSLWKKNSKENGHYHSVWLSMMYPRLYLARNLLSDDGVIFISIDDNEAANLKLVCDEIFGEESFVAHFPWRKRTAKSDVPFGVSSDYESVLAYARNSEFVASVKGKERKYFETDDFPGRPWRVHDLTKQTTASERPNSFFTLKDPKTGKEYPANPLRTWAVTQETFQEYYDVGKIVFPDDYDFLDIKNPVMRYFKDDDMEKTGDRFGRISVSTRLPDSVGMSLNGTKEITELFEGKIFDFPKPSSLIQFFVEILHDKNALILDFFAGSGTTMQAVMELNLEDGGSRQCICVQIPEKLEENTEAYKAGYRSIADITRARIDKVIEKLKAEQPEKTQDLACAQFTLAPSNFKQWRSNVDAQALREQLEMFQQAEKTAPQAIDTQTAMLAELLLKMGLGALGVQAISKAKTVAGVTVHRVLLENERQLWLCFEPYHDALKDEIAQARPAQVVMLNSCFVGDKADEQLANLQLELQGLDIGLTVI